MKQPEVGSDYIRNLLQLVQANGASASQLFAAADLPRDAGRPDAGQPLAMDAASYSKLYTAAIKLVGDECFGFFGPGRLPWGTFAVFCEYLLPARTLADALRRASRFFNWMQKLQHRSAELKAHTPFSTFDGIATLNFINQSSGASPVFITQRAIASGLSSWHNFLGWLIGAPLPLLEVRFQGRCQLDEGRYQRIFKAPLRYQQQTNACLISAHLLDAPIAHSQQSLEQFLQLAPYHLVGSRERDSEENSLSNRVKQQLGTDFAGKLPGIDKTAKLLGLTPRNLRTGLAAEGASFQTVRDEARLETAIRLLADSRLSTTAVAQQMGFEDDAAFQQAFKLWTGVSPQRYRQCQSDP